MKDIENLWLLHQAEFLALVVYCIAAKPDSQLFVNLLHALKLFCMKLNTSYDPGARMVENFTNLTSMVYLLFNLRGFYVLTSPRSAKRSSLETYK